MTKGICFLPVWKGYTHIPLHCKSYIELLLAPKRTGQPIKAFVETITCRGAGGLDEPLAVAHVVKSQLLRDLSSRHRVWKILLVRKDEQHGVTHLVLVQHLHQLFTSILSTITVITIHHEDQALRALVIVA